MLVDQYKTALYGFYCMISILCNNPTRHVTAMRRGQCDVERMRPCVPRVSCARACLYVLACVAVRLGWLAGAGAFGYTPQQPPAGENIICTTRSHSTKAVVQAVDDCEPTEKLKVGGAGHKVNKQGGDGGGAHLPCPRRARPAATDVIVVAYVSINVAGV